MKNSASLIHSQAQDLTSRAAFLRDEAADLEERATQLLRAASLIETRATYTPLAPRLRQLATAAHGLTGFELAILDDAQSDPELLDSEERNRLLILARQFLGLHLELPPPAIPSQNP